MTNHPTPVVLDDEQLQKIEARPYYYVGLARRVELHPDERDALCATVRALRRQYEGAVSDFAVEINALRERLVAMERCHADAEEDLASAQLRIDELESRLAQVEKERDDLRRQVNDES